MSEAEAEAVVMPPGERAAQAIERIGASAHQRESVAIAIREAMADARVLERELCACFLDEMARAYETQEFGHAADLLRGEYEQTPPPPIEGANSDLVAAVREKLCKLHARSQS